MEKCFEICNLLQCMTLWPEKNSSLKFSVRHLSRDMLPNEGKIQ